MSKRLPNLWQEVILVSHGAVIIKFNSNLDNFLIFLVFQYPVLIEMLIP